MPSAFLPEDPLAPEQWHLLQLGNIQRVWSEFTGLGIHVGVYDDGIQFTHPDLTDNYDATLHMVIGPTTFSGAKVGNVGHGTAVAGLIATARSASPLAPALPGSTSSTRPAPCSTVRGCRPASATPSPIRGEQFRGLDAELQRRPEPQHRRVLGADRGGLELGGGHRPRRARHHRGQVVRQRAGLLQCRLHWRCIRRLAEQDRGPLGILGS